MVVTHASRLFVQGQRMEFMIGQKAANSIEQGSFSSLWLYCWFMFVGRVWPNKQES